MQVKRLAAAFGTLGCVFLLLLCGCGRETKPVSEPQAEIIELPKLRTTPTPEPAALPRPDGDDADETPDMTFDESGNIRFSDAMKARFSSKQYVFDHAPRVLIYHTHAREAFREPDAAATPTATPTATPSGKKDAAKTTPQPSATPAQGTAAATRSDDPEKTVVHLGDLLVEALRARGFEVFHDRTNVEAPELSTAYARSAEIMAAYEDVDIYIDLHRNAADPVKARDDVVVVDGKRTARMFFVVGTGVNAESDAGAMPNWEENYTFALSLYEKLAAVDPRLVKENRVKQGYYNQQAGLCLLAEIGHNANLMTDAEQTVPLFATALAEVCTW